MNNHDYPLGSDTPDAPWNQGDEPMKECDNCNGFGHFCMDCDEPVNRNHSCNCGGITTYDCPECEGKGERAMTQEEIWDEEDYARELNAECERDKE